MNFPLPDFAPAYPEIFLLCAACVVLLADLFYGKRSPVLGFALTQLSLAGAALITYATFSSDTVLSFSNMFIDDVFGDFLKLLTYLAVAVVLVYSRSYLAARRMEKGEFYLLVLFATLGMMVMISANHFLTLYIGLELMSLSLYALVASNRDSALATEAAMKYFVLGALASGLLLYGMSMVYGATGTLEIGEVAHALYNHTANRNVLLFGLVFIVGGLAFKLGVVPFHMWIPDVYHGAPTAVTLLIGSAPKLAAFAMVLRMLVNGLFPVVEHWQPMLLFLAVLSIGLGNLAAIAQSNIKRMLAYSAISHMGFMLLGLVSGVVNASSPMEFRFNVINAYSASLYYAVAYVLMSLASFGIILLLSRAGFEADRIDDFKGLNKRSPWFAAMMMMVMFSMAGVPFFVGFFAKFSVLQAVVAAGTVQAEFGSTLYYWVAAYAVMMSLIGAYYYLRVVKVMYFDAPEPDAPPIQAPLDMRVVLSVNGLAIALFGVLPESLMYLCAKALDLSL
jgi:NADH-quinone oxidoreductase subunit N